MALPAICESKMGEQWKLRSMEVFPEPPAHQKNAQPTTSSCPLHVSPIAAVSIRLNSVGSGCARKKASLHVGFAEDTALSSFPNGGRCSSRFPSK